MNNKKRKVDDLDDDDDDANIINLIGVEPSIEKQLQNSINEFWKKSIKTGTLLQYLCSLDSFALAEYSTSWNNDNIKDKILVCLHKKYMKQEEKEISKFLKALDDIEELEYDHICFAKAEKEKSKNDEKRKRADFIKGMLKCIKYKIQPSIVPKNDYSFFPEMSILCSKKHRVNIIYISNHIIHYNFSDDCELCKIKKNVGHYVSIPTNYKFNRTNYKLEICNSRGTRLATFITGYNEIENHDAIVESRKAAFIALTKYVEIKTKTLRNGKLEDAKEKLPHDIIKNIVKRMK